MKDLLNNNRHFLIASLLVWLAVIVIIAITHKTSLHLWVTSYNHPVADFFFRYYTEVGASIPFVVAFFLLFYKYSASLLVLGSQLVTTIIVFPLKRFFDVDRPKIVFEQLNVALHQIDGVRLHSSHSFPSGHTAAAFALFFSLVLLVRPKWLKLLFFFLAMLVGYSRVYLSQHFVEDTFAGSIIGVAGVLVYYFAIHKRIEPRLGDKSLRDLFCKG